MPHKPRLTQKITCGRVNYLWGQVRRGNIRTGADIDKKIYSNLPVKEEDVVMLREKFIDYANDHGWFICDNCNQFDNYVHFRQHGMTLCENCVNVEEEAEEL